VLPAPVQDTVSVPPPPPATFVVADVPAPVPLVIETLAQAPVPPVGVTADTGPTFVVSSLVPLNSLSGSTGTITVTGTAPLTGTAADGTRSPTLIVTAPAPTGTDPSSRILESIDNGFPAVRANEGTVTLTTPTSDTGALNVLNGIPNTSAVGDGVNFSVPRDAFVHSDPKAIVKLDARQVDGQPLPTWLMFDGITGLFNGRPAAGSMPTLQLEVIANDDAGRQARTTFTILGESAATRPGASNPTPGLDSINASFPAVRLSARELGVATTTGSNTDMLVRFHPVPDQDFTFARGLSFSVPGDAFAHTNPRAIIRLEATQVNGDPLPGWLTFDGVTGRLSGTPPDDFDGVLRIRITARDNQGLEASTQFTITVGESAALRARQPAQGDKAEAPPANDGAQQAPADGDAAQDGGDGKPADGKDRPNAEKARKGDEVSKSGKQAAKRGAARFADQIRAAREQGAGQGDQALLASALKSGKPTPKGRDGGR
jgi:hypothetical protein